MNIILQQICEKFIGEVAQFFSQGKNITLEEMETSLKEKTNEFILEMIKTYLEQLDQAIVEDKAGRKEKGIVIERRNEKREQYLAFGQLAFKRTYFYDKKHKEYIYLLDKAVGIENYDRVSGTVTTELIEHASETSYGESSRHVTGNEISRHTVMKKLRKLRGLKTEAPLKKRKVKILHVNADEDHIALQNGKKTIVPLISIHEGIKRVGKRGQCINPHYISSHGKEAEELWLEACEWIYETYDIDHIERIYLYGDGASWIKEGLNWLPKAKMVLDRYHLNKAVTIATSKQPEKRTAIHLALSKNDKKAFKQIARLLNKDAKDDTEKKKIREFINYINNNWEGITIYNQEECGGSCTEGHVSHVLSSRLSSRPMGWSKKGLKIMAELRAYKKSGGQIKLKHFKNTEAKYRLEKTLLEKTSKTFDKVARERFNNVTILNRGKVIPMFECLRGFQNGSSNL